VKNNKTEKNNTNVKRLIYTAVVIIIILVPTVVSLQFYFSSQGSPKAAIIDQLGSSKLDATVRDENQTFIEATEELLHKRFSVVDYYSDNATVEEYKLLASEDYKLIIWRAHTGLDLDSDYVAIAATDRIDTADYSQYNGQYLQYLENGQLTFDNITGDPQSLYFSITPKFIEQVMTGTFHDTAIVLMGCNGLEPGYLKTAQAFEAKGAKVFISWNGWISPSDNDYGGTLLLQYLINENDTVSTATSKIPVFDSEFGQAQLLYDPPTVANYRIPDYTEHDGSQQDAFITIVLSRKRMPFITSWNSEDAQYLRVSLVKASFDGI
jgi:hypothetical protein